MSKQWSAAYVTFFIYFFVIFWGAITPLFFDYFPASYLTGLFLLSAILFLWVGSLPSFAKSKLPVFYLSVLGVILAIHIQEISTVVNVLALAISFFSILMLAWYGAIYLSHTQLLRIFINSMSVGILILFCGSVAATALNIPGSPEFYPWESLFSDYRMILVAGGAGHTNQLWLLTWIALCLIALDTTEIRIKGTTWIALVLIIFLLILTKTRLSLFFIGIILFNLIASILKIKNSHYSKILVSALVIIVSFYYASIFSPEIYSRISNALIDFQASISILRIAPSESDQLFSWRDILNQVLIDHWTQAPWFGLGDGHPIFQYGINQFGDVAKYDTMFMGSESGLNALAKYGAIFFFSTISVAIAPILAYSPASPENEFRLGYALATVNVFTFFFNGSFINYYGLTAVALFLTLLFYFRGKNEFLLSSA